MPIFDFYSRGGRKGSQSNFAVRLCVFCGLNCTCYFIIVLAASLYSCAQSTNEKSGYLDHVGDTKFNIEIDDPTFKVCDEGRVFQYYNFSKGLQYKGEKPAIDRSFKDKFISKTLSGESGFLTIRFVVNCKGQTGWFRVQGMNNDFKEKKFNQALVDGLLKLTKELDGWIIGGDEKNKVDYYQYLTFKLLDGNLIEIMP